MSLREKPSKASKKDVPVVGLSDFTEGDKVSTVVKRVGAADNVAVQMLMIPLFAGRGVRDVLADRGQQSQRIVPQV